MKLSNSFDNIDGQPCLTVNKETVTEISQEFLNMSQYSLDELSNKNIADVLKILRIGPDFDIENVDEEADYFMFTKSLEVKFFNIRVAECACEKLYNFIEKPHLNLDDKLPFVNRLLEDNNYGIGIFSLPDITLLKANETYISFFDTPFNKKENCLGRRVSEFVTSFEGSTSEKLWDTILATGKTYHVDEYMFDKFERGITYWKGTLIPIYEDGKLKYCVEMTTEITEQVLYRKKLEEQAKVIEGQKQELEMVLDNMTDGFSTVDKDGNYINVNKTLKQWMNNAAVNRIGDTLSTFKYYDLQGNELTKEVLPASRVIKGEIIERYRMLMKCDKYERYVSISGTPVYDENGCFIRGVLSWRDITDTVLNRKKLQEQVEEINFKNKQLEAIIESLHDNISIFDKYGRFLKIGNVHKGHQLDPNSHDIWKVLDKTDFFDLQGNPYPKNEVCSLKLMKGQKVRGLKLKTVVNGVEKYYSLSGTPLLNDDSEFEMGVMINSDITDVVNLSNQIKEHKEQLELELADTNLLQSISMELICEDNVQAMYERIIDGAMQIMHSEYGSLQMLHTGHGEGNKLQLLAFRGFNPQAAKFWEWVYAGSGSTCGEALRTGRRVIAPNVKECNFMQGTEDQVVYLQTGINAVQTTPLYSRSGRILGMISTHWREPHQPTERELKLLDLLARQAADLIEQKQYQERLLQAEREKSEAMERAMEMKDEFLSLISHEFKTPLNVINTAIQALNFIYADEMTDKVKEYMGTIRQNTYRQLRLVNNLLDITRANAGRIKINKKNIDIVFLTKAITESVYEYASHKGVRVTFLSSFTKKIIGIDDEKYERIILNLLSNAIKFTSKDKSITVKLRSIKGRISVEVKDEGIGIPPNKMAVIFERFGQVDSSLSRQAEGTGIGLSLVKKFVEGLGGSISVKSKVGKGTTFTILLPDETVIEERDERPMIDLMMDNRLIQTSNIEFSDIYL